MSNSSVTIPALTSTLPFEQRRDHARSLIAQLPEGAQQIQYSNILSCLDEASIEGFIVELEKLLNPSIFTILKERLLKTLDAKEPSLQDIIGRIPGIMMQSENKATVLDPNELLGILFDIVGHQVSFDFTSANTFILANTVELETDLNVFFRDFTEYIYRTYKRSGNWNNFRSLMLEYIEPAVENFSAKGIFPNDKLIAFLLIAKLVNPAGYFMMIELIKKNIDIIGPKWLHHLLTTPITQDNNSLFIPFLTNATHETIVFYSNGTQSGIGLHTCERDRYNPSAVDASLHQTPVVENSDFLIFPHSFRTVTAEQAKIICPVALAHSIDQVGDFYLQHYDRRSKPELSFNQLFFNRADQTLFTREAESTAFCYFATPEESQLTLSFAENIKYPRYEKYGFGTQSPAIFGELKGGPEDFDKWHMEFYRNSDLCPDGAGELYATAQMTYELVLLLEQILDPLFIPAAEMLIGMRRHLSDDTNLPLAHVFLKEVTNFIIPRILEDLNKYYSHSNKTREIKIKKNLI